MLKKSCTLIYSDENGSESDTEIHAPNESAQGGELVFLFVPLPRRVVQFWEHRHDKELHEFER